MLGKLLVVEDQSFFRKGLVKMIESQTLGWSVVGEAYNGEEAVQLLHTLKPDLVLTDIRMPGMSGIELAEYIHTHMPHVLLIILTGFKDFEYAQAGIRYGVLDFLIKPCNIKVVRDVLGKALEKHMARLQAEERLKVEQKLVREQALRSAMLQLPYDTSAIADMLASMRLYVSYLSVETYYPAAKNYREDDLGLLQFAVSNIVHELMNEGDWQGDLIAIESRHFGLLLNNATEQQALRLTAQVKVSIHTYLGLQVEVHEPVLIQSPKQLSELYHQIKASGTVSEKMELGSFDSGVHLVKMHTYQTELAQKIMLGQISQLQKDEEEWLEKLGGMTLEKAKVEVLSYVCALQEISRKELAEPGSSDFIGSVSGLQNLNTYEELNLWTRDRLTRFYQVFTEWQASKTDNPIAQAIQFIELNYMRECSLNDVAQALYRSETYLSKMFRKETGDTFINYVTKIRMDKAKLLLANTNMKITEIAFAVGYDNSNYFTAVFKNTQQTSPTAYRKQFGNGSIRTTE